MNTGTYRFQLKKLKTYAPLNAIKQVKPMPWEVPVLVTAGDNEEILAALPFDELLRLLKIKYRVK